LHRSTHFARTFGCVTQLSQLIRTIKCQRYQWDVSRSAAPVVTAASTHAKPRFHLPCRSRSGCHPIRKYHPKGLEYPQINCDKPTSQYRSRSALPAYLHISGPRTDKSDLPTIRSSGFPPRDAPNSIRRPWRVSRDQFGKRSQLLCCPSRGRDLSDCQG